MQILSPLALEIGLLSGLAGWLFSAHLTQPGEVFSFWPALLQWCRAPEWLQKPLFACAKCVAAQAALWWAIGAGMGWGSALAALVAMAVAVALARWIG